MMAYMTMPIWKMILNQMVKRKRRKALWLPIPTQLLIQGQWWSNLSTHWLHIAQWRDLADLITLHSGHKSAGLMSLRSSRKLLYLSGFNIPAFLQDAIKKNRKTSVNVLRLASWKYPILSSWIVGKVISKLRARTTTKRPMNKNWVLWFLFKGMRGTFSIKHSQYF